MSIAGSVIVAAGLLFVLIGVIGLFRFPHFYYRVLLTANIDAAGMLVLSTGVALQSPDAAFAAKVIIIAVLALITGPLSTHAIVQSARAAGCRIHQKGEP